MKPRDFSRSRGMTMLEVIIAIAILSMVAVLIHGVMDSLSRAQKGEGMRADRAHQGREAMQRIVRDLSAAYLSRHVPANRALATGATAFVGRDSGTLDRVDFTAFAHLRTDRDSHESDEAEVGYFSVKDPDVPGKTDLVRREQSPIDSFPQKGGVVDVIAEDIDVFDLRYLDPITGRWTDAWDSTQAAGQPFRLPLEVSIHLVLLGVGGGPPYDYTTKVFLPIQQPLTFGIAQ